MAAGDNSDAGSLSDAGEGCDSGFSGGEVGGGRNPARCINRTSGYGTTRTTRIGDSTSTCPPTGYPRWKEDPQRGEDGGRSCYGQEVVLQGHVEPRDQGVEVTFNLIPNPGNDTLADQAVVTTGCVSKKDGIGRVKLHLPLYGGTKFKVGGKTDSMDKPVNSGELWVWRRIFYQTTEMKNSPAPENLSFRAPVGMIEAVRGALEEVYFEIQSAPKSKDTAEYQKHVMEEQRAALASVLRSKAQDARSPFKINVVLIDRADIFVEQEWASEDSADWKTGTVRTPSFRLASDDSYEHNVLRAEYQTIDGVWKNLENVRVLPAPKGSGYSYATGRIPGFPKLDIVVAVRIKYRYQRGNAGGWGGGAGTIFVCIGRRRRENAASPTAADLQNTLTHEIGHVLGLVPKRLQLGRSFF